MCAIVKLALIDGSQSPVIQLPLVGHPPGHKYHEYGGFKGNLFLWSLEYSDYIVGLTPMLAY